MSVLYNTDSINSIILYNYQNLILLQKKTGHTFGQAMIAANDFKSDLSDTIYNNSLYYSYLNTNDDIVIHTISGNTFKDSLKKETTFSYLNPLLTVCFDKLILLYVIQNHESNLYSLMMYIPYSSNKPQVITENIQFCSSPFSLLSTANYLYIHLTKSNTFLYLDKNLNISTLSTLQELKEQSIMIKKTKDENTVLLSSLSIKDKKIEQLNAALNSAIEQYNDLMTVAESYRNEAIKWNQKFISLKNQ